MAKYSIQQTAIGIVSESWDVKGKFFPSQSYKSPIHSYHIYLKLIACISFVKSNLRVWAQDQGCVLLFLC